jgi:hypothetical protein
MTLHRIAGTTGTNASDELIVGTAGSDTIIGSGGDDVLVGGLGADTFTFRQTAGQRDGHDVVKDFHSGEDHLQFVGVSPREITRFDTAAGLEIHYGGFGGASPTHGVILLEHVHQLAAGDFLFA